MFLNDEKSFTAGKAGSGNSFKISAWILAHTWMAPEKFAWGITAHSVINTSSYGLWKRKLLSSVAIKCRAFTELDGVLIKDTRIFWHKNRRILIGYEKILSRT